jgi:hypothetical protein
MCERRGRRCPELANVEWLTISIDNIGTPLAVWQHRNTAVLKGGGWGWGESSGRFGGGHGAISFKGIRVGGLAYNVNYLYAMEVG